MFLDQSLSFTTTGIQWLVSLIYKTSLISWSLTRPFLQKSVGTRLRKRQSKACILFIFFPSNPLLQMYICRYLLRPDGKGKIIVCTGMVMQEQIKRELGCFSTIFKPAHAKDRLSNEFGSFINYTSTSPNWILEKDEDDAQDPMKTRRED